jgi:ATP-binding cassette subfamily B protein
MHRRRLALAIVAYAIKDAPLWVLPLLTAAIIDTVVQHRSFNQLTIYVGLAVAVLLQNYPIGIFYNDMWSRTYRQVGADLRNRMVEKLQGLSIGFHSRASASVIQNKVVRDVESIEQMLQSSFPPIMSATFVLIGAITNTAIQVPAFVFVFAVTVPLGAGLVWFVRTRSHQRNEHFRREVERFSSRVGEMATLMPITRAHGLESHAAQRVADSAEGVRRTGFQLDQIAGRFGAVSWLSFQLLSILCLFMAAGAALTGFLSITPGQVVLLSSYFTLLTNAVVSLLNLMPMLARGRESIRSIAEVLQDPDLEQNAGKATVGTVLGRITLERVTYRYEPENPPALADIDLVIEPGETVAFVGPSGSGKSTMLNLVLGFLRPDTGRILLDDVDMQSLDLRTYRSFVSVVPQESVLFEGSVRDNVTYGLGAVDDGRVLAALRDANAMEIIEQLPDGWNTVVGERGARLSGGQRQRFAIARALIRNPRVLLLDEATSALDSQSEALVKDALDRLMDGRTSLVVAHRLATVRSAHRIVVLDRGRVAEIGSHDELVALGGIYSRLANAQRL